MNAIRQMKATRRRILRILYNRYLEDPLASTDPYQFFEQHNLTRNDLVVNIHYLHDSGLVELLMGYAPPLFSGARITAKGIDVVENPYEFNLRFPAADNEEKGASDSLPALVEQFTRQVEQAALDGETRRTVLRDAWFLREELARPPERRRNDVILAAFSWMERLVSGADVVCQRLLREARARLDEISTNSP